MISQNSFNVGKTAADELKYDGQAIIHAFQCALEETSFGTSVEPTSEDDEAIYFTCSCHTPHHFLHVSHYPNMDEGIYFTVTDDGCAPLWRRIKTAIGHVFRGQRLRVNEVLLNPKTLMQLSRTLNHLIGKFAMEHFAAEKEANDEQS